MSVDLLPNAVGYCAGAVVSLVRPFMERKTKEEVDWTRRDEFALARARRFLVDAFEGGPYNEKEFNLIASDPSRVSTVWLGLRILMQMTDETPIDLEVLKRKLENYIDVIGRMEAWQIPVKEPKAEEKRTLTEVETFFRKLIDYSDAEEYRAALA
jgi:hypothetical protein